MGYKITTTTEVEEAYAVTYRYSNGDFRDPPTDCEELFLTETEARNFIKSIKGKTGYSKIDLYKKVFMTP